MCGGKRFTPEVLDYSLRGRTIADVLDMSVQTARQFFTEPAVSPTLTALDDAGLG